MYNDSKTMIADGIEKYYTSTSSVPFEYTLESKTDKKTLFQEEEQFNFVDTKWEGNIETPEL